MTEPPTGAMPATPCPPAADLRAFHGGRLPGPTADAVAAHLEGCAACEAALQKLDAGEAAELVGLRAPARDPGEVAAGDVIGGRYRLVELVGEGGMGAVWRADQTEPVRRAVAVKLIKAGMDSKQVLARFAAERQALAIMDHPSIAKVLDAGQTEHGRPYFVMELVAGVPITNYCDARRLTPRDRLALFVPVCQAVQHAHQKGVIHRDLKPGNILVAEADGRPVPKVIDFGIAKAAGAALTDYTLQTGLGAVVGTPEYMAPEQAGGAADVDTRADVYALGVVLYELLTGSTPLTRRRLSQAALMEVLRLVREEEPPPPSSRLSTADALPSIAANRGTEPARLSRLLRGELDWVVMKALDKDRGRRYESAGGLARDVERYLADEPVEAGKPTAGHRLRKLARRHRRPLVAAAALGLLLAAAAGVSTRQAVRATRAEARAVADRDDKQAALVRAEGAEAAAQSELADRQAVQEFFQDTVFAAARPKGQDGGLGKDVTLRQAIDAAEPAVAGAFKDRPLVEAAARESLGETYSYLGEYARSVAQYEAVVRLREARLAGDHPDTVRALGNLAAAYGLVGREADALRLGERVLALRRVRPGPDDPLTLISMTQLAIAYLRADRTADAVRLAEEAAARTRAALGPDDYNTVQAAGTLATAYRRAGRWPEAVALHEATLDRWTRLNGPDDPNTLSAAAGLAQLYLEAGRPADAVRVGEGTAARMAAVLGPDHPYALINQCALSQALARTGRAADAVRLGEDALARARAKLTPDHPIALSGLTVLAGAHLAAGRPAAALPLVAEYVDRQSRRRSPDDPAAAADLARVGELLVRHRQFAAAEPHLRTALAARVAAEPAAWATAHTRSLLGDSLLGQRRYAEAEPLLVAGYEGLARAAADLPAGSRAAVPAAADRLVRLYQATARPAEAARWRQERAKYPPETAPLPRPSAGHSP